MNEIAELTELCKETKCYGFFAVLIDPETGEVVQYTQLIEPEVITQSRKNFKLMQFFTDDAGYALLKALLERE